MKYYLSSYKFGNKLNGVESDISCAKNTLNMKNIFIAIILTFAFVVVTAQGNKTETIIIKTKIYCDHCVRCESCGANINETVRGTEKGIKKVKINPADNTITVTFNAAKTTPDKIREAIAASGYDADNIKAAAEGYAKLDGCCKAK